MKVTRNEAIAIAKKTAGEVGYEIDKFELVCQKQLAGWHIFFSRDLPGVLGDNAHFSIYVDKASGESQLFRGR